jgi:hypothetical protein
MAKLDMRGAPGAPSGARATTPSPMAVDMSPFQRSLLARLDRLEQMVSILVRAGQVAAGGAQRGPREL